SLVSPFMRSATASAAISASDDPPSIRIDIAEEASRRERSFPSITFRMNGFSIVRSAGCAWSSWSVRFSPRHFSAVIPVLRPRRDDREEVREELLPLQREDRLRVELHPFERRSAASPPQPHHEIVVGLGGDLERRRHGGSLDDQGMVSRRLER